MAVILGLAGPAGAGKDEVAQYLKSAYGFVPFAFSSPLYREVQDAYGLEDQTLLRDRATKELPTGRLSLQFCNDKEFVEVALDTLERDREIRQLNLGPLLQAYALSPRWVLQHWGTNFRRAQNDRYWLEKAGDFIRFVQAGFYPEQAPQHFVECGTRFENERQWVKSFGEGNVWHIHRDGLPTGDAHVSAQPLPVLPGERELFNNSSIERLHRGIDLLMRTNARFVRVSPMAPYKENP